MQDVITRWNSTFFMLESILINKDALKILSLDPACHVLKSYVPSDTDFEVIEDMCSLLRPLNDLTDILIGSKFISISILYATIFNLVNYELPSFEPKSFQVLALKNELIQSLSNRFYYVLTDDLFLATTLLDFKFRNFEFIQDNLIRKSQQEKGIRFISNYYHNTTINNYFEDNLSNLTTPSTSTHTNSTFTDSASSSSVNSINSYQEGSHKKIYNFRKRKGAESILD